MARQEANKRKTLILAGALTLTSVLALAPQAMAGFEWSPPPQVAAPPVPAVPAAPAAAVESEVLEDASAGIKPFPLEDEPMTPMGGLMPASSEPVEETPVLAAPVMAPAIPAPPVAMVPRSPLMGVSAPFAPVPPPPEAKAVYETVDGFGSDIPLALAMRQIVPPGYSYAFDPDINPGVRISWNGGKSWNQVLEDAVRPGDMRIEITGNTVRVRQTWDVAEEKMQASAIEPKPFPATSPLVAPEFPAALMRAPAPAAPLAISPDPAAAPVPPSMATAAASPAEEEIIMQSYPRRVRPDFVEPPVAEERGFFAPITGIFAPHPGAPVPVAVPPPAAAEPPLNPTPAKLVPPGPTPLTPALAAAPVIAPAGTVSPSAVAPGVLDPYNIGFWQAEQGASLKSVLGAWSSSSGVAMLWNSGYDYILPAPVRMHGTFPDAVTQILASFGAAEPRPVGKLHPNLPQGPSVLVIENYSSATN